MSEFQSSLPAKDDHPEGQMVLAGTSLVLLNFRAAEAAFLEAVRLDPQLVEVWQMTACVRATNSDREGVVAALRKGLQENPGNPELFVALKEVGAASRPQLSHIVRRLLACATPCVQSCWLVGVASAAIEA